jgi:alpha-tubulin suppressor-like RCC1 family protein
MMGINQTINYHLPQSPFLPSTPGVRKVVAGSNFAVALLENGEVFAWGNNHLGQLGNGTTQFSGIPVQVAGGVTSNIFLRNVVDIAAGTDHVLALLCSGRVVAWGSNHSSQLGLGTCSTLVFSSVPVYVQTDACSTYIDISAIAAGAEHSLLLRHDGRVASFGNNSEGALGIGNTGLSNNRYFVLNPAGTAHLNGIQKIAAGGGNVVTSRNQTNNYQSTSYAIDYDGNVYAWGSNDFGQIGNATSGGVETLPVLNGMVNVLELSAGLSHNIAIVGSTRQAFCWGENMRGQIGNGSVNSPVSTPFNTGIGGVVSASAGARSTIVVDNSQIIRTWGDNLSGQLGLPFTTTFSSSPASLLSPNPFCEPLMPCDDGMEYCFQNITIPTGLPVTWDITSNPFSGCSTYTIEGTLTIPVNADLTIDGITLLFGPKGKIIVERGTGTGNNAGRLQIIGGADLDAASSNCMWEGIEAQGHPDQYMIDNNQSPAQNPQQAYVFIEASTIQNAHIGILMGRKFIPECSNTSGMYTGAIFDSDFFNGSPSFLNNNVSLEFPPGYTFFSVTNTAPDIIGSLFNCNQAMQDEIYNGAGSRAFVRTTVASPKVLQSCSFTNSFSVGSSVTIGIEAFDVASNFKVTDCFFSGCNVGLQCASPTLGLPFGTLGNNFHNCATAIHTLRTPVAVTHSATANTIVNNPASSTNSGIVIEFSPGSDVVDAQLDNGQTGISVVRSGNYINFPVNIIKNDIDQFQTSMLSLGNNRYSTWNCNTLDNYTEGWRVDDFNGSTGRVQQQGNCTGPSSTHFPAGNLFNVDLANPSTIPDIVLNTSSSFNFQYIMSSANFGINSPYEPNGTSGLISLNPCAPDEITFCQSNLQSNSVGRGIASILAERDTVSDTLNLSRLNGQALWYYLSHNLTDSAIWYLNNYGIDETNDLILPLLIKSGLTNQAREIIASLPDTTEEQDDLINYFTLLCDLIDEERTYFELDSDEIIFLNSLAIKMTPPGRMAAVLMSIINNVPIEIPCILTGSCEESRFSGNVASSSFQKLGSSEHLLIFPNPTSHHALIMIPESYKDRSTLTVSLVDISGKEIYVEELKQNQIGVDIDVSEFNNGIYFVSLHQGNKLLLISKMVIIK